MNLADKLSECEDFPCIFGVVKTAVDSTIGERRGGLLLGLTDLPGYIGAFHQVGSNFIVMNKSLLEGVLKTRDRKVINAYVFHILLHEYLHTLGYLNEEQTHMLSGAISEATLGPNHPATLIAKHGIGSVIPEIGKTEYHSSERLSGEMEIVQDFEVDDLDYLG